MAVPNNGIVIISRAADGTQGNDDSGAYNGGGFYTGTDSFSVSADGTKIAFMSDATNLVPEDGNGLTDIFVKDLKTGAITLASTVTGPGAGRSLQPSLSPDGTKIAFATTPFVNGAPFGAPQVYIKDLITGTLTTAVTGPQGSQLVRGASSPVFSPDGSKLAFYTSADLTNAGAGFNTGGLYIKDLSTGAVTLLSSNAAGKPGNGLSSEPTFSPDGTKIAFTSASTNLGPTTRTGLLGDTDVYVKNLITGAVTLVSSNAAGQRGTTLFNTPTESANPAFSPDGTKVAFQSSADDLVPGDNDQISDVFIKDLTTGAITRITTLADGTSKGGYGPAFSSDGTKIAFWTGVGGYIPNYYPSGLNIYVKDLVTGSFTLVSAAATPTPIPAIGNSQDPQFSRDGSEIVFWSDNAALVANDANGNKADVFVKTLSAPPAIPPVAAGDTYTTPQDTPLTIAASAGLLANDTDPGGKPLTALLVTNPAHGALTLNTDGSFTYIPAAGYRGADTFTYKASDGPAQSPAATVSLTVTAVNHPVIANNDSYLVPNTFPASAFTTDAATGVLANDTSADGGLVVLGLVVNGVLQTGFVRTAAGGSATLSPDGRLNYDQPFSSDDQGLIRYNGTDSFTYRVRDADGSTADATVTLHVGSEANNPVFAIDDSYSVSTPIGTDFTTGTSNGVLANDFSLDFGLVVLGIVVGGAVQTGFVRTAAGGSAEVLPDGRIVYQQPFSTDAQGVIRYVGLDSFSYRVRDGDGSTADATVTLSLGGGVNHPVFATDDSYSVPTAFPATDFATSTSNGVLANDFSQDFGLVALGIVVGGAVQTGFVATAAGGQAELLADGRLVYRQPFSFDAQGALVRYNGIDNFTYRVRDGDGSTADATVRLTVGTGVAPVDVTIGDGPDDLVLSISEDAYLGDARYTVSVDGQPVGGVQTATAARSMGQAQTLDVKGTFGTTPHTVTIDFLNDAYDGTPATDRNLHVDHATINGVTIGDSTLTLSAGGPQSFHFGGPAAPTTIGIGPDTLDLFLSEDAYLGDARLAVSVDGTQIGGPLSASASHSAGQDQVLHVLGTFGATPHTVSVDFLNDVYGGTTTTDRNLYLDHSNINGATIGDSTLTFFSGGLQSFHFGGPAAPTTIGNGPDTLDLLLSEDAYLGDAQFTVSVDGSQIGGLLNASASHAKGQDQILHVLGTFGAEQHTVSVDFRNDAYAGTATTDRNLYVDGATINGHAVASSNLAIYSGGPQSFTVTEQHAGPSVMPV